MHLSLQGEPGEKGERGLPGPSGDAGVQDPYARPVRVSKLLKSVTKDQRSNNCRPTKSLEDSTQGSKILVVNIPQSLWGGSFDETSRFGEKVCNEPE